VVLLVVYEPGRDGVDPPCAKQRMVRGIFNCFRLVSPGLACRER